MRSTTLVFLLVLALTQLLVSGPVHVAANSSSSTGAANGSSSSSGANAGPCDSSPCQNGGTCTVVNSGFACSCPSGFEGTSCETAVSSSSTGAAATNSSTAAAAVSSSSTGAAVSSSSTGAAATNSSTAAAPASSSSTGAAATNSSTAAAPASSSSTAAAEPSSSTAAAEPSSTGEAVVLVVTPPPIPAAVTASVSKLNVNKISVLWEAVSANNASRVDYILEAVIGSATSFTQLANTTTTAFTVSPVQPATTYVFRLSAFNTEGTLGFSANTTITTLAAGPSKPLNVATGTVTETSVVLTWDEPANLNGLAIDGYVIEYMESSQSSGLGLAVPASPRNFTVKFLKPGTSYTFAVTGRTAALGNTSDTVTATTLFKAPEQILDVVQTGSTASSVVIKFDTPKSVGSAISEYKIAYALVTGSTVGTAVEQTLTATANAESETATISSLQPNSVYQVTVKPKNGAGLEAAASPALSTKTLAAVPGVVGSPASSAITATSATVTWTAPSDTGGDPDNLFYRVVVKAGSSQVDSFLWYGLSREIRQLTAGTAYTVEIFAGNSVGLDTTAGTVSFTTLVAAPQFVSVVAADSTSSQSPGYSTGDTITITFDEDTNQASGVTDVTVPTNIFDFTPALSSDNAVTGAWSTAKVYVITAGTVGALSSAPGLGKLSVKVKSGVEIKRTGGEALSASVSSPFLSGNFGLASGATTLVNSAGTTTTAEDSTKVLTAVGFTTLDSAFTSLNGRFTLLVESALGSFTSTDSTATTAANSISFTGVGSELLTAFGTITYATSANFNGLDSVFITVHTENNAASIIDFTSVAVTVTPVNDAPTVSGSATAQASADTWTSLSFTVADVDATLAPTGLVLAAIQAPDAGLRFTTQTSGVVYEPSFASAGSDFYALIGTVADVNTALGSLEGQFALGSQDITVYSVDAGVDDLGNGNSPTNSGTSSFAFTSTDVTVQCAADQAAPTLDSAQFLRSGYEVVYNFSSTYIVSGPACSDIFDSATVAKLGTDPECYPSEDGKAGFVVLGLSATLAVGDNLVTAGSVKTCSASSVTTSGSVAVAAPARAPSPVVEIVAPKTISFCDDLFLFADVTAGSLGRDVTLQWSATNSLLANSDSTAELIQVPSGDLTAGTTYTVSVTATNFFGAVSDTVSATVTVSNLPVPQIVIGGSAVQERTRRAAGQINFLGAAILSPCLTGANKKLDYTWTVSPSVTGFSGLTTDSPRLRVPFSGLTGSSYVFTLTGAMQSDSSITSSTSVTLELTNPPLEVSIKGGLFRKASAQSAISVETVIAADPASGTPTYAYTCQTSTGTPCYDATTSIELTFGTAASFTVAAGKLRSGTYTFTSTVTKDTRSATATQRVQVVQGAVPQVIISDVSATVVNFDEEVYFVADINTQDDGVSGAFNTLYKWTVVSGDYTFNTDETFWSTTPSLILNQDETARFTPGVSYTFQLEATQDYTTAGIDSVSGVGQVSIRCNSRPAQGQVAVSPATGTALETAFEVTASKFEDADLPLLYSFFAKFPNSDVEISRTSFQPSPKLKIPFFAEGDSNNKLVVGVEAQDAFGATTVRTTEITITPKVVDTSALNTLFSSSASDATNVDNSEQLVSVVASVTAKLNSAAGTAPASTTTRSTAAVVDANSPETALKENMLAAMKNVAGKLSADVICNSAAAVAAGGMSDNMADSLLDIASSVQFNFDGVSSKEKVKQIDGKLQLSGSIGRSAIAAGKAASAGGSRRRLLAFPTKSRQHIEGSISSTKDTLEAAQNNTLTIAGTKHETTRNGDNTPSDFPSGAYRFESGLGENITLTPAFDNAVPVKVSVPVDPLNGVNGTDIVDLRVIYGVENFFLWDTAEPEIISGSVLFELSTTTGNVYSAASYANKLFTVQIPFNTTVCPSSTCAPVCKYFDGEEFKTTPSVETVVVSSGLVDCKVAAVSKKGLVSGLALGKTAVQSQPEPSSSTGVAESSTGGAADGESSSSTGVAEEIAVDSVRVQVSLNLDFNTVVNDPNFKTNFTNDLATATGQSASRFVVRTIAPGSVVVTFDILAAAGAPSSTAIFNDIVAQVNDPNSVLQNTGTLGTIEANGLARVCADGSTSNTCPEDGSSDDGLSGGAIAGIVIGVLVFVAIVGVVIYLVFIRKSNKATVLPQ